MMKWIHIDFMFYGFNYDTKFLFEDLIRKIVKRTRWIVRKKFYLYEAPPDCFLALELRSIIFIPYIVFLCWLYRNRGNFMKYMGVHTTAGKDEKDEENGEGFLNILNAFTEWYLFDHFNSKTKLSHIIHCCLEFQSYSRGVEIEFYKQMVEEYGIKRKLTRNKKTGFLPPKIT